MPKLNITLPHQELVSLTRALRSVTSRTGQGVYASSDHLFKGAVFGRDSLEVAEDLLEIKPRLVRDVLMTLASMQGLTTNDINEEEPGKILHEYRNLTVDGKPVDDVSRFIFEQLTEKWGREGDSMTYYGSIDATPLFVRLLGLYTARYGKTVLKLRVKHKDGSRVSLLAAMTSAVDWIMRSLNSSTTGLLEYQRRNPHGIENQVWKDSVEFYVHENGNLANVHKPIASIEVQGLVYDALTMAAKLLPDRANELISKADEVRDRTIEMLWKPERQYFALGLDHAVDDSLRCITTTTANPAALLDTLFFDGLNPEKKEKYVGSTVSMIMGHDFLTDAGIRSRGLSESKLIPFWDYHGSFTSWPKETYDIARGLHRQGFPHLAMELENRLLNVVKKSRGYPEFVYVDPRGRVLAGSPSAHSHGHLMLVDSTNKPENVQAWTLSAVLAIMVSRLPGYKRKQFPQQDWQKKLELHILAHVPHVRRLRWRKELSARYPDYNYGLVNNASTKVSKQSKES